MKKKYLAFNNIFANIWEITLHLQEAPPVEARQKRGFISGEYFLPHPMKMIWY